MLIGEFAMSTPYRIVLLSIAFICTSPVFSQDVKEDLSAHGEYYGRPLILIAHDEPGKFSVKSDFAFHERNQRFWHTEGHLTTDCASIPPQVWKYIGEPCTEEFVAPAVIHDRYANEGVRDEMIPFRDVHDMFYYALLANGVDKFKARMMWAGVRFFGPRWKPSSSHARWLSKYGRKFLESDGQIIFMSRGSNFDIEVKLVIDEEKLEGQKFNTDWFDRYQQWLDATMDAPFAMLQTYADTCDSLSIEIPTREIPPYTHVHPGLIGLGSDLSEPMSNSMNPGIWQQMTIVDSLHNFIEKTPDLEFDAGGFWGTGNNYLEDFHMLSHDFERHDVPCPNTVKPLFTFGERRP